jgi:mannose/fructose/N-acetylgalactosamine-specific phosphotransferase system component IIC
VAAPLLGLLLGNPAEGVVVGLLFELLFLESLPVGAFIPDQGLFPALMAITIISVESNPAVLPTAVIVSLPSIAANRWADARWRRGNEKLFNRAEVYVRLGRPDLAEIQHLKGILSAVFLHFWAFLLSSAVLVPVCAIVLEVIPRSSVFLAMAALIPFLTGLAAVSADRIRRGGWIGFAVGLSLGVISTMV